VEEQSAREGMLVTSLWRIGPCACRSGAVYAQFDDGDSWRNYVCRKQVMRLGMDVAAEAGAVRLEVVGREGVGGVGRRGCGWDVDGRR
jgi:hypothetical protein